MPTRTPPSSRTTWSRTFGNASRAVKSGRTRLLHGDIGGEPGEVGLRDAVEKDLRIGVVELVVAEGHEEPVVERGVAVEQVERVDHGRAVQVLAHHRGEEKVAGVEHEHRPPFALDLLAQGAHAGHPALAAGAQAFDLVGVVDLENREAGDSIGGRGSRSGRGARATRGKQARGRQKEGWESGSNQRGQRNDLVRTTHASVRLFRHGSTAKGVRQAGRRSGVRRVRLPRICG